LENTEVPRVRFKDATGERTARWRSEGGTRPPQKIALADDTTRAAVAFRQACEGAWLLYRGDWRNARQLLTAMSHRIEERRPEAQSDLKAAFQAHRQFQSTVHQVLSRVLVVLDERHVPELRTAPDVREACLEVWGPADEPSVVSLRELLGMVGAHEWRKNGLELAALGGRIHPHYGVFAPIRSEYVDLVAQAPLARVERAFDVGTGTGVLALVLAKRGVAKIVATDVDPRCVVCARENVGRFGLDQRIEVQERDLFPEGLADLIVFNPPWMPAQPRSPVEKAIFDPDSRLLLRFLKELPSHLAPGGESWLIVSDLAELIGLRPAGFVPQAVQAADLMVVEELSTPARHPRSQDKDDALFAARSRERTVLHRLERR